MPAPRSAGNAYSEFVKEARKRTRNAMGSQLEGKATDEFCVAFGGAAPVEFAEAMAAPGLKPAAVLELAAEPEPESEPPVDRQAGVKAAREDFYRRSGLIRDDVERATSALFRGGSNGPRRAEEERLLVELCWLNRTVRTADARAISGVAGDPAVERVDVPRRLEGESVALDVMLTSAAAARASHGLSGEGVTVAVIDSESALGHPALGDRVIHRRNYTQEPWGTPAAHGTAVAGIIGAAGAEYTGMAPEATIYNYKVLATHPVFNATDFEGALAIQQALEDGVRVANCSWGAGPAGDGTSREARACDRAWRFGLTIVKSAGNLGPGQRTLTTPADAEGVIVVGATGDDGRALESYSSRGPTPGGRVRPHLVAPGGRSGIGLEGLLATGGIGDIGWGTSYAAPHVTGLLALLLERDPELSPAIQRERLLQACRRLSRGTKNQQGAGLVSPERLLGAG